jgi:putative FmdB family regulatory protein
MPIFEYLCPACEHAFEELVRNNETVPCPKCGHREPQKLMSATAGHVQATGRLPLQSSCPPSNAPPCSPRCCRLP